MDVRRIAVIGGTGPQGRALAPWLVTAGHTVVLGSRSAERARAAVVLDLAAAVTGRRGIDVGALRLSSHLEPLTAVLIGINRRYKIRSGLAIVGAAS